MIEQFKTLTTNGTEAMLLALKGLIIAGIGFTYWKSRAMVPTVSAVVVGGIAWWAVNNIDTVKTKVDSDLGAPVRVVEVPARSEAFWTVEL